MHYLWDLPEQASAELSGYIETLAVAARSITHLGWGVDMVAANAKVVSVDEATKLRGHVWRPGPVGGTPLRVPIPGTLAALVHRHGRFLVGLYGTPSGIRSVVAAPLKGEQGLVITLAQRLAKLPAQ